MATYLSLAISNISIERLVTLPFTWTPTETIAIVGLLIGLISTLLCGGLRRERDGGMASQWSSQNIHIYYARHLIWALFVVHQDNNNSKIKDHWWQITTTKRNKLVHNEKQNNEKVWNIVRIVTETWSEHMLTQRQEVSKRYWKNGTESLAGCRVATYLQFVKNTVSETCNKTRYACTKSTSFDHP